MELRNYRKFRRAEIEFPDGIIGIIGPNGAGKSTLIEAISWALYGNEQQIVRTNKEEILFAGASPAEECRVTLEFELSGDQYRLVRSMRGKDLKMKATLEVNGKLEAEGDKAVTRTITNRLGMDYKSFFISVFARQKDLNALTSLRVHERKKLVLRMLDIDSLDRVMKLISSDISGRKKEMETLSNTLRTEEGKSKREVLKEELTRIERQMEEIREQLKKLRAEKEKMDLKLSEAKRSRDEMERLDKKFRELKSLTDQLSTRLEGLEANREEILRELAQLREIGAKLVELKAQKEEFNSLQERKEEMENRRLEWERRRRTADELEKTESDLREVHAKIEDLAARIRELGNPEESIAKVKKTLDEVEEDIRNLRDRTSRLESEIQNEEKRKRELEERRREISELGPESNCPTCERRLGDQFNHLLARYSREIEERDLEIGRLTSMLNELRQRLSFQEKRLGILEKRRDDLTKNLLKLRELSTNLRGLDETRESLERKRAELVSLLDDIGEIRFDEEEYERLKERITVLRQVAERYSQMQGQIRRLPDKERQLETVERRIDEIQQNLTTARSEISALPYEEGDLKRVQSIYEEILNAVQRKREEIITMENDMRLLEKEAEGVRKSIRDVEITEGMLKRAVEDLELLSGLENIMKDFKQYVISRIVPMLSELSSTLFSEMTDSKYEGIELNDDYEIFIFDGGKKFPVERFSGGENDLANLCLRLAISRVLADRSGSSVDFLILDEIFGSQDQNRKRNILVTLNKLASRFRQIILITHIDDVKEFMGNVLYVKEMEDGSSVIEAG